MNLLLTTITWSMLSTMSRGQILLISIKADFLCRILQEGLSADQVTTTDVYFMNFVQPEYIELHDAVIRRLKMKSLAYTMFLNTRNQFARNRLFLLIAVPQLDTYKNYLDTVLGPTLTHQQLAENSQTIHVIAITLNINLGKHESTQLLKTTLGWFKTHQFILVSFTSSEARIYTVSRNMSIQKLHLNDTFYDLFYNRPSKNVPPQYFAAMQSQPRVIYRDGHFEGLDVTVFNTIMGHLNLSYRIIYVSETDPSLRKMKIEKLFNEIAVIGMLNRGKIVMKATLLMTLPNQDGLCILIPKSQHKHLFYHLLQPLETSSWLMLCGLLFIGAFFSARWSRWFHQNLLLSLFYGSTVKMHRMHRLERFIVIGSAIFFTVLFEAYLAKFIFHMTTFQYERDPQTFDEFVESPHMLLGLSITMKAYTAIRSSLETKMIGVPKLDYNIINNTEYGYILPCTSAKTILGERAEYDRLLYGTNVRPSFHLVPEKIEIHHLVYHFSPYFFYYAQFKLNFDQLFEAGFTDLWEKNMERQHYVNPAFEFTDTVVLDMERLHLLWAIYGIGSFVSLLAFIGELVIQQVTWNKFIPLTIQNKITAMN
uniref:ionotropic receptor 158 precursor n=1 Tax=Aedes aegypti TaxID=7159 RepID=UPI000C20FE77|nr:ionotropic receptor 158 precursor [Aedes aegypti]